MATDSKTEDPLYSWWFSYYRFRLGRDSPSDARNTLLVAAALIAAVTFQAGMNPPGGVWQDNSSCGKDGKAILASDNTSYTLFIFANTLAFSASINIIHGLVINCPFQMEVLIAIYSMTLTYFVSIYSVGPDKLFFSTLAYFPPPLIRGAIEITRCCKVVKKVLNGTEPPI